MGLLASTTLCHSYTQSNTSKFIGYTYHEDYECADDIVLLAVTREIRNWVTNLEKTVILRMSAITIKSNGEALNDVDKQI